LGLALFSRRGAPFAGALASRKSDCVERVSVARARRLARRTGGPDSDGVGVGAGDAGDCAPLSACGEPWAAAASAASANASHDVRARGRVGDAGGSPSGRSDVSDGSLSSLSSSLS